jgi:hypothetical protein
LSIFEDDFGLDSVDGVERIHVWLVAKWVERRTFLLCAAEAVLTSASGAQQRGGAGGHIQYRRASVNDSIDPAAMTGFGIIPNPRDIRDETAKKWKIGTKIKLVGVRLGLIASRLRPHLSFQLTCVVARALHLEQLSKV